MTSNDTRLKLEQAIYILMPAAGYTADIERVWEAIDAHEEATWKAGYDDGHKTGYIVGRMEATEDHLRG